MIHKCIENIHQVIGTLRESTRSDAVSMLRSYYQDAVRVRGDIEKVTQDIIGISKRIDHLGKTVDDKEISKQDLALLQKSYDKTVQVVADLMDAKNSLVGVAAPLLNLMKKMK